MCASRSQRPEGTLTAIRPDITAGIFPAQMPFCHIPNNGLPKIKPSKTISVNNPATNYREQIKQHIGKKRSTQHKDFRAKEKVSFKQPKTKPIMDSFYEHYIQNYRKLQVKYQNKGH